MKKSVLNVLVLSVIISFLGLVSAQGNESNLTSVGLTQTSSSPSGNVDNAYQCLNNQVSGKTGLSLQEATAAMMALGSVGNFESIIRNEEGNSCWPKSGCTLKDTSQVALAYRNIGRSTSNIKDWLTSNSIVTSDLRWFLEIDIDNHVSSQCAIVYDGKSNKITIGDDMSIGGSAGSCFTTSSSGYWLEIKNNCFGKNITISCDQDFVTSKLYQKSAGGTVFVSSETHSASSLGTTEETFKSRCFTQNGKCDYEGNLWASLAMYKSGADITEYLPYLLALADDNQKYFPSAFLYILTGGDDEYSNIIQSQQQGKYWTVSGTLYNRYYDTSIAMLALSSTSAAELDNTRNYLLSIQTKEGCWNNNNIRDTALILYSGWPKTVAKVSGTGLGSCEAGGYYCAARFACVDGGGQTLDNYDCTQFGDACCSVKVQQQSCSQQNGKVCVSGETCSGTTSSSSDGSCCLADCSATKVENVCELTGIGTCRTSCGTGEQQTSDSCGGSGNICCSTQAAQTTSYLWLWIVLIILIILIILGIIYRDKLKVWWHKIRKKPVVSPITRPVQRPMTPGMIFGARPQPAPGAQGFPRQPLGMPRPTPARSAARPVSQKEKEMEETLRKLRDMSK